MPRSLASLAALAAPALLTGCDLAVASPFMPPILPGVGFPLQGTVLDATTRLPIGGATVQSGLGSTITDGNGHFNLYGGLGSREVSCSRAGYTAVTDGDVDPNLGGEIVFQLEPVFASEQSLPTRFLQLAGTIGGLPANAPALVTFAGKTANVSNNQFQLEFGAQTPGKAFSAVLAWGTTSVPVVAADQPFNFTTFYNYVANWGTGENVPAGHQDLVLPPPGTAPKPIEITNTTVKYANLPASSTVNTEILLDYGVLGSVTVARATGSNQAIPVPKIAGLKYDIVGRASDGAGGSTSVQLTTNDPAKATFQLLSIPKISSPANNAKGAGQRPTFAWSTVPQDVLYQITLFEEGEGTKWVGRTRHSEIQYPAFSPGDINGGALRTDKKYTWSLQVIDALGPTDLPSSKAGPAPTQPYRIRQREASVEGYGFAP